MYSMEGGCFNTKEYNNEVIVKNSLGIAVASVVFGEKESDNTGSSVLVKILESQVDKPLMIMFAMYVLKTGA